MEFVWIGLGFIAIFILFSSFRIVQEYERGVVFFLGRVTGARGPGLIVLIPIFERMTYVSLRTVTMEIPAQKIITKDNVSIDISGVCYFKVADPQKSVVAIENVYEAINQISQTTL